MRTIFAINRPRVKPTRHAPRPAAPFGQGLIRSLPAYRELSTADDAAWAARALNSEPEPDWDAMAQEAEFQRLYEEGVAVGDRCSACWRQGELTAGLCGECVRAIAESEPADPDNGGICGSCGLWSDYRDAVGRCPVCDSNAAESASQRSRYAGAGLGWIDP